MYSPLDRSGPEIRLLRITPNADENVPLEVEMHAAVLDDDLSFTALSYVWGDPMSTRTITANTQSISVTSNLAGALRQLRKYDAGSQNDYWIDALCINQQDIGERNQQVRLMGKIYSSARLVISFLGPPTNNLLLAADTLEYLVTHGMLALRSSFEDWIRQHHQNLDIPERWDAVRRFMLLPYWTRCWIVQEIILAPTIVLMLGDKLMSWDCITALYVFRYLSEDATLKSSLRPISNISEAANPLQYLAVRRGGGPAKEENDVTEIYMTLKFKASDPRDKIFAFNGLGICRDIVPDYNLDARAVYCNFSKKCAESDYLSLLLSDTGVGQDLVPTCALPSWTLDLAAWSHVPELTLRLPRWPELKGANGGLPSAPCQVVNMAVLKTEGVKIDQIAKVWPVAADTPASDLRDVVRNILRALRQSVKHSTEYVEMTPLCQLSYQILLGEVITRSTDSPEFEKLRDITISLVDFVLDETASPQQAWEELGFDFENGDLAHFLKQSLLPKTMEHGGREGAWPETAPDMANFLNTAALAARLEVFQNRAAFVTEGGLLGVGPKLCRSGDAVWVLNQADIPVLLREQGPGEYLNVGGAWVPLLMDGQVADGVLSGNLRQEGIEIM